MAHARLSTVGAFCALVTVAGFVVGIALMASSGVQVLVPETGKHAVQWLNDAEKAGDLFVAGATVVVFAGLVALGAFLGFYDAVRKAGPVLVVAPAAGIAGMVLVTISHATPIAIALELAPAYKAANETTRASLVVTENTLAQFCQVMNYFGDALVWGVATPLFAFAGLETRAFPRWIGWLGLVAAVFAGWIGLFSPISSVADGLSTIGFFAFFVFFAAVGVALLRRRPVAAALQPAS